MKILIVPDVHGRKFWHKAEELISEVDQVVFLGDYLDPYSYEGITFEDAITEFKEILDFKEKYSDKVILLIGNHDCHYLITSFMNCSRLHYMFRQEMHDLFMNNIDKFQLIYEFENYLFSHAGIYKEWMDKYVLTLDDLKDYRNFLKNRWKTLEDCSYYRGGWNNVGSCVWADLYELSKNELYTDKRQIVGHSQLKENPYITDTISYLDVRQCFILDIEKNEIKSVTEETTEVFS